MQYYLLPQFSAVNVECALTRTETHGSDTSLSDQSGIAARYRITSLVRRHPAIQLSFAFDMQLQRLIALRDIDVSGLDEATRKLAYAELQQEYDLLRASISLMSRH